VNPRGHGQRGFEAGQNGFTAGRVFPHRKESAILVLSRNEGQRIMIGENIVITLVSIHGDKVRLGIDAPPEVSVHREEIWNAIKRDKESK
jgi:carbon storage regulator